MSLAGPPAPREIAREADLPTRGAGGAEARARRPAQAKTVMPSLKFIATVAVIAIVSVFVWNKYIGPRVGLSA